MSRHCTSTLLTIILLNLTACKVWHKQGTDEEDLRTDQQQCEGETRTSKGQVFIECMKRLGWQFNDMSSPAGDSEITSATAAASATAPGTVRHAQTPPATTAEIQIDRPESPRMIESLDTPHQPTRPQNIKGWYQLGTNSVRLDAARSECKKTGADSATLIKCMENRGWHPIYMRISLEEPGDLD